MIKCIFEISTGLFVSGSRWDTPAYNPATQVLLILPFFPSRRGHRLNATNDWFRSATASEIAAQDALTDEAITVNDVVNALNDADCQVTGATRGR